MNLQAKRDRTWAEIDLSAIRENFEAIRTATADSKLCCVVKANAYGHGAVRLSSLYERLGADWFAVSNMDEALQLRNGGITKPILILGYTDPDHAALLSRQNISQCVFSLSYAKELSESAARQSVTVKTHIKIDTGMGRIGFLMPDDGEGELSEALTACRLTGLIPEGIFTHFCVADEGEDGRAETLSQFSRFGRAIAFLEQNGISFSLRHCANSAAALNFPQTKLDMARVGIALYGLHPSDEVKARLPLRQALQLKSVVCHLKTLRMGMSVSYGKTFVAPRDMTVATVPIGYADGLWRSNAEKALVEIEGQAAPIIGRICMDQCMVDVSHIPNAHIGSVVTVYGQKEYNSIDRVAKINGTVNYEILCSVGERVPRLYTE